MKKYEKPSFWELKKNRAYRQRPQDDVPFYECVNMATSDEKVVCGRVLRSTKYVKFDPAAVNAKYKYTDFCLENLVAAGTELVKCPSVAVNLFDNADAVLNGLVTINDLVEAGYTDDMLENNENNEVKE